MESVESVELGCSVVEGLSLDLDSSLDLSL